MKGKSKLAVQINLWMRQTHDSFRLKVKMLIIILAKIRTITLQITKHSLSFRIRLLEEKSSYLDYSCYSNSCFSDTGMKSMQTCTKKNVLKIANRQEQYQYNQPTVKLQNPFSFVKRKLYMNWMSHDFSHLSVTMTTTEPIGNKWGSLSLQGNHHNSYKKRWTEVLLSATSD